jgi:acyl dehydratase
VTVPPAPEFRFGPVTRTDLVRCAGASGDFSAGLLASFVTRWFGAGSVRRYKVRFRDRVWPGDVLEAKGTVVREFATATGERRAELALELVRQDGAVVVSGSAEVVAA